MRVLVTGHAGFIARNLVGAFGRLGHTVVAVASRTLVRNSKGEPCVHRNSEFAWWSYLVDERIVIFYYVAALSFLTISMIAGLLMALQLVHWYPFKGVELLSPGRWRMIHTNAIAYGFLANAFLGPRRAIESKFDPYESGMPSEIKQGFRFGISFYLIAMLFLLFDIEVLFLYPIAVQLRAFGTFALIETAVFIGLLFVAFVYVWRRGALTWK